MTTNRAAAIQQHLEQTGAWLRGHFLLSSGLHSAYYIQCAQLLQYPALAAEAGEALAALLAVHAPQVVMAPALGGIIIGHEVAHALGARFIFTERTEGRHVLRRGFSLKPGERVVVIEDVITTGGSAAQLIEIAAACSASPVAAGAIVIRGPARFEPLPLESLVQLQLETYEPADCPLCRDGMPCIKPGTTPQQCNEAKNFL